MNTGVWRGLKLLVVLLLPLHVAWGKSAPGADAGRGCAWQSVTRSHGFAFAEVAFSTARQALGIAQDCVWATEDGGQTWERRYCHTPPEGTLEPLHQLVVPEGRHAWMLMGGRLVHSSDGGRRWTSTPLKGVILRGIGFSSPKIGWTVGERLQGAGGGYGVVYRTGDGGQTWTELPTGLPRDVSWRFRAVWPLSSSELWVVGDFLLHSTDGGHSWNSYSKNPAMLWDKRLTSIRFLDAKTGWIEQTPADGRYWVTRDGGDTFDAMTLPDDGAQGLIYTTPMEAWVLSAKGIHHSADGGRTWTLSLEQPDLTHQYSQLVHLKKDNRLIALSGPLLARCQVSAPEHEVQP